MKKKTVDVFTDDVKTIHLLIVANITQPLSNTCSVNIKGLGVIMLPLSMRDKLSAFLPYTFCSPAKNDFCHDNETARLYGLVAVEILDHC